MEDLGTLVRAAQAGDKDAFGRIVRRFQDMAFAFGYAVLGDAGLAQDAAQEAFIDAYLSLANLREPAAFPGWFRRVVMKHTDRQVRRGRRLTLPLDDVLAIPADIADPAETAEAREVHDTVHDAIAALPPRQRLVTTLFHLDGYSHREIESFLELPVTTIKKTLFTARKRLKERLTTMLKTELNDKRPSQTDAFARKVQFFIALKTGDLRLVESLLDQSPDLLETRTEWSVAMEGYWPVGYTPLHWAAASGDQALLSLLLSRGADVNATTRSTMTPLHLAVLMRQSAALHRLLAAGPDVNALTDAGHTALHIAAIRNNRESAEALLARGANPRLADKHGRTAVGWAILKDARAVVETLGGEMATPRPGKSPRPGGPVLETGLKVVDLFAPLRRGGENGVFTPLAGVGRTVVLCHIVHAVATRYGGHTICVAPDDLSMAWREMGVDEHVTTLVCRADAGAAEHRRIAGAARSAARELRAQGREVVLMVDAQLALSEGVIAALETGPARAVAAGEPAISVIYYGDPSVGAEPEPLASLDTAIAFSLERAQDGLWPAIDPLRSRARWATAEMIGETHARAAADARRLLHRYADLGGMVEKFGVEAGLRPGDREPVSRARRLDRFLTQPIPGAEPWTGVPGYVIALPDTLEGTRAIIEGACDDLAEEALYFTGTLADARNKAQRA